MAGIRVLLRDVAGGHRLTEGEALRLMGATGRDIWAIAECADRLREERVGEQVTYVRNQNLNVTNICVNSCGFCGFSRKEGDPDAYFLGEEEVREKAGKARERKVTEICTVSGLHPDFTAGSYVDILTWIRESAPGVHLHAGNPMEVAYGAAKSGISTREMAARLREAGLGSMCG
ncbi:MAG TPA: radical SAM protein, partial [Methanomicrobiales archaeon]|nr:radical SAM protein [Methanomicrobiales archaeon]